MEVEYNMGISGKISIITGVINSNSPWLPAGQAPKPKGLRVEFWVACANPTRDEAYLSNGGYDTEYASWDEVELFQSLVDKKQVPKAINTEVLHQLSDISRHIRKGTLRICEYHGGAVDCCLNVLF